MCSVSAHTARPLPGQELALLEYEDSSGTLDFEAFLEIPPRELRRGTQAMSHGYTRSSFWARARIPAELFPGEALWLQLGPNFLDHLTVYRRALDSRDDWHRQELGDLWPHPRGDIDYRRPLLVLPEPAANSAGYELVFHYRSSSAVVLRGELWEPGAFLASAGRETAFWSFYFGLAVLSTGMALLLALLASQKLAWLLCLFSSTYLLVACIQGYVDWLLGPSRLHLQHYLTGILTLASYGSLFWMCAEALNTRRYNPRLHRLVMLVVTIIFVSLISIPLDFYGVAIRLQFVLCCVAILLLGGVSLQGLRQGHRSRLERGFSLAALWYLVMALSALLSLFGVLPFHKHVYALWQYGLVVNTLIVLTLITLNVVSETRLERAQQQLTRDLRVAREARFHQRQFMGMVAHEFRTPLSVISAALQNLRELPLSPVQRFGRENNIARATERLIQLTDNCLADSRLATGQLQLEYGLTDVGELIDSAASIARLSSEHRLEVRVEAAAGDRDTPDALCVQADSGLLRIALSNLIDNAVKYSKGGNITVRANLEKHSLRVTVCDQGEGIAPSLVPQLFERFQYGNQGNRGTGLGLHVAREIARAHGGDLQLDSNTPRGCCFTLQIPLTVGSSDND